MKHNTIFYLLLIPLFPLVCTHLYAGDQCDEPSYPDQFLFEGCRDATTLGWDWDNSTLQLGGTSNGRVSVIGGQGQYTWTVSGSGFYLNEAHTLTSITTDNSTVTIYTSNACGPCDVTVTDVCDRMVQNSIRAEGGQWVSISASTKVSELKAIPHTDLSHVYSCADDQNIWCITYSSSGPTYTGTGENGRYRVTNRRYHKYYGANGTYTSCDASACSSAPPGYGHLNDVPGFPSSWCWVFGGNPPLNCDYIKYRSVSEWRCN